VTEIGTTLGGRYRLLELLGQGGMATIYRARDAQLERDVAVKLLRPEFGEDPDFLARFRDEARAAASLSHPNIVPVFDFGEVGGAFFIAEEHIVGRDLARLSKELVALGRPPLSVNAVLYVIHETLSGLMYVHGADQGGTPVGFVHRDVSPQNVMISRIGDVKLLDFGIMKANHSVSQTDIGTVKGNVDFMSPEQARGRAVDQRSDLFSVGLVLYHCLARAPLYQGESLYDRLSRAASGPGPDELARIATLPPPIPQLLGRALEIDPTRRFQTAGEFRAAVAAHVGGGESELTGIIGELFGHELQGELDRLAAVAPPPRVAEQSDRKSG
jgi:eukaryotic-like serine/threonine-protein kinase